jgi:hypothetical protein
VSSAPPGRIQAARLRAENAKLALATVAVCLFLALLVIVRASHPAASTSSSAGSLQPQSAQAESDDGGFDFFSQGSVSSPSQGSAPVISSGGS